MKLKNKKTGNLFDPNSVQGNRRSSSTHHGSVRPENGVKRNVSNHNLGGQEMMAPKLIITTIGEIQNYPEFVLAQTDDDIAFIKEYVGKEAKDFDGFFVKQKDGDMIELYGFQGTTPDISKSLTKITTPAERLATLGSRGRERVK